MGTVNFTDGIESEIKFGNQLILDEHLGVDEIKIIHASQSVLLICWKELDSGSCRLAQIQEEVNGIYTVDIGKEEYDFEEDLIDSPTIFRVPPNVLGPNKDNPELLGVCYVDENNGKCKFGKVDLNGDDVNEMELIFDEDATKDFADRGVGTINAKYLGYGSQNLDKLVVCYVKYAGSTPLFNRGLCKYGTITV